MKYLNKSFSVFIGGSKKYEENYDRIFRKKRIISNKKDLKRTKNDNRK